MILGSIMVYLSAAFIIYMLGIMYYSYTDYMDIPNVFDVAREILGGWILAVTMCVEEREERTNELGYEPFGLSV